MCAKPFLFRLVTAILLAAGVSGGREFTDFRYLDVPGGLIDAHVNDSGDVFLLMRGLPHLMIISSDGSTAEFDLEDIVIPGGMCVDRGWGWFVTGEVTDMVYRYHSSGEMIESWESAGLPGDIALAGLSVLYVSRADGTVRSLYDPDAEIAGLEGSGDGQLTSLGSGAVYSGPDGSMILGEFRIPEPLPDVGTWTARGNRPVVLRDSCVCQRDGTELLRLPAGSRFSRLSFSDTGSRCLLWTPGEDRVMVAE